MRFGEVWHDPAGEEWKGCVEHGLATQARIGDAGIDNASPGRHGAESHGLEWMCEARQARIALTSTFERQHHEYAFYERTEAEDR